MSPSTRPDDFGGSVGPAFTSAGDEPTPTTALTEQRYVAGGELGRGGMGVVAVATDTWLDREVALKRPRAELSAGARDRLVHEARITARLDHPGVVPVLDVGVDADGPYYTMPVLDGATLRAALGDRPLPALVRVLEAASRAVAYAHARGVVHRDLKPDNLLIGAFGEVRVLDWGVALDPAAPDAHVVGTPGFQAPELVAGRIVGPPADVFALGRTLAAILERHPVPALAAVVERATRADPADRYSDGGAFADELERWLDGRRVEAHDYTPRELAVRLLRAWRAPLAVGAMASAVGLLLLTAWATTNGWERDRAVAAEAEARAAQQAADQSLAAALQMAAASHLTHDARPAAEVLASRALALHDDPEARGVLMAWHGLDRPTRVAEVASPCVGALPAGGAVLCVDDALRVLAGGAVQWTAPLGGTARSAVFDGRTAVVVYQDTSLEVWRGGVRVRRHEPHGATLEPASGEGGVFLRGINRVAQVGEDGTLRWSAPLCDRIEDAWTDGTALAAACVPDTLVIGDFEGPKQKFPLGHPLSAVTRHAGRWVVGTFDGLLLAEANGFAAEASGVGAVEQLVPWGPGVVVAGEELTPRLWDPAAGVFLARLPRRGRVSVEGDLWLSGETLGRWTLPASPAVGVLSRGGGGGLAFLALSPAGDALLGGNSSGDVTVWDPSTGAATPVGRGCLNVAKSGALFDRLAYASQLGCEQRMLSRDWRTGAPGPSEPQAIGRLMERWGERLVIAGYGHVVLISGPAGLLVVDARPVALSAGADLWALDPDGAVGVLEGDAFARRFIASGATDLSVSSAGVLVVAGRELTLHDATTGEPRWTWTSPRALTAVEFAGARVVAGDLDGRVYVLDVDGVLRATARGHSRRVSEVRTHGDLAYTASWDGTLRRWDLRAADSAVAELVAGVDGWGLTVEELLGGQVSPTTPSSADR